MHTDDLNRITEIRANNVNLAGGSHEVYWNAGAQQVVISNVPTWERLGEILDHLQGAPRTTQRTAPAPINQAGPAPTADAVQTSTQELREVFADAEFQPKAEPQKPVAGVIDPTPAPAPAPEDLSAFGRMNLLGEIVTEIVARGATTYPAVWAYVLKLRDTEMCPAIERLEKEGKLEERVKRQCVAKGIEGAL